MPKVPFWVFILIAILYFTAVRVDTMDVDASQYAEMSREMLQRGDYLHLYDRGVEYLDKPPFLFWVSSASMGVFGVNNFGYKLPSILFALWALFATYRLGRLLYDDATGRMAALVLATCQGMFLMTNDVRCDTILMSWVVTAIWLIREWEVHRKLHYLLLGAAAIAFGMMTKGPIAVMVPVFCFASDWILKRQWKNFFRWEYIVAVIVIVILLIPMSIGLYQQFDMHPGKMVNGKTGVSGLRFFFWSQSFGRITGENPWKNGADMSFLLVNMLWSFLPWIFLWLIALVMNSVHLVKQKFKLAGGQEWICTGGFLLTYLSLGSSQYQLPHYIFVAFPLAAIMTAKFIGELMAGKYMKVYRFMTKFQVAIMALLFAACLALITVSFPSGAIGVVLWLIALAVWLYIVISRKITGKLLWASASAIVLINIFLTNFVYYNLLKYEVGTQLGKYIRSEHINADDVISYKMHDPLNALDFYAQEVIGNCDSLDCALQKKYVITMDEGLTDLQARGYTGHTEMQGEAFKVSELTPGFLNPATRKDAVKRYYLVRIK